MPPLHSNAPRILVYGQDEVLLYTRSAILRTAGMQAKTIKTRQELEEQMAKPEKHYDLYVLCHSISTAEQHEICAVAAYAQVKVYPLSYAMGPSEFLENVRALLCVA